jgi:simple sugar transport system permease protein
VLALLAALLACAAIGLANGLITMLLRVPSFITTLGMLYLLNGLTLTVSRGQPVEAPEDTLFGAVMGGWPWSEILWGLLAVLVVHTLLRHTRWGLHTVAAGGNPVGAAEAGIDVRRIKIGNFVLTSVLGGLTGVLEMFRVSSADPLAGGSNVMFLAVAAGVIGGTPLVGGSGTILGGLFGVIVLSLLRDGFTMQGVNAYAFDLITGAAILVAMVFNIYLERFKRTGWRR